MVLQPNLWEKKLLKKLIVVVQRLSINGNGKGTDNVEDAVGMTM